MAAAAIGEDICYPAPQRLISVERGRNPSRTLSMLHWHISAETRRLAPMQTSSEYRIAWSGQSTTTQLRYVEQLSTRKHGMQTVLMLWLTSAGTSLRSTSMESTARDRRRDGRDDGWSRGRLTAGGRKPPSSGAAPSSWLPAAPRAPQRAWLLIVVDLRGIGY
jgi:hypothetical protein